MAKKTETDERPVLLSVGMARFRPDGWAPLLVQTRGKAVEGAWLMQMPTEHKHDAVDDCYQLGWRLYGAKDVDAKRLEPTSNRPDPGKYEAVGIRKSGGGRWLLYVLELDGDEVTGQRLVKVTDERGDALDEHYRICMKLWMLHEPVPAVAEVRP